MIVKKRDPRADAYDWAVSTLRADPALKSLVRVWWTTQGEPQQDGPIPEPPAGHVNVRITPLWEPETPYSTSGDGGVVYQAPVTVQVEVVVFGEKTAPDAGDAASFWGLVQEALPLSDRALRAKAHAAGVSWWEWGQPGTLKLMVFLTH